MGKSGYDSESVNRGASVMMQCKHGAFWLAPVVCLAVAGAAFSGSGHGAAARRLVLDPGTFVEMPSETTVETMSLGTGHTGPRIELRRPGNDSVFRRTSR